jgi:LPS-assembly lipoprotein
MWWPSPNALRSVGTRTSIRLSAVALLASLTAGCFEPLYGERTLAGGPGLRDRLRSVEVMQIAAPNGTAEARLAVEVRNALIFEMSGGEGNIANTHRLAVQLSTTRQQIIVDIATARPESEVVGINANYTLTELASGRSVVTGNTFARVSFDTPGQAQRFARARGQRDAENRAAKVVAENIRTRLASYFSAGT